MNTLPIQATITASSDKPYLAFKQLKQQTRHALNTIQLWRAKAEQRRKLRLALENPDFLSDIGVSLSEASIEANKPFWK